MRFVLFSSNLVLVNVGFLIAFLFRYGPSIPESSFLPYKNSFVFLSLIYAGALAVFGVYKKRFKSSWELFQRAFWGLLLGTLLSVAFVYVFRIKLGAFATSVFGFSFVVNLILIFKVNQFVLRAKKRVQTKVIVLGEGKVEDVLGTKKEIERQRIVVDRKRIDQIQELFEYDDFDQIVISENITDAKNLNLLLYMEQKLKIEISFTPSIYMNLLPERLNGNSVELLNTFVGKRSELDESLIRMFDIVTIFAFSIIICPAMFIIALLIKITSLGSIFYKQQRVGKDGKFFVLYKFRTMVNDAEEIAGFLPATENDLRVTKIGKWLRMTRLDELPQLLNVLKGEMSLVGPRPENLYRVGEHKALQGLRLAVKPGLTGLAQIRSCYDLHPRHKIKYDYLYIQRRSLWLNIDIMLKTIPAIFFKKGW